MKTGKAGFSGDNAYWKVVSASGDAIEQCDELQHSGLIFKVIGISSIGKDGLVWLSVQFPHMTYVGDAIGTWLICSYDEYTVLEESSEDDFNEQCAQLEMLRLITSFYVEGCDRVDCDERLGRPAVNPVPIPVNALSALMENSFNGDDLARSGAVNGVYGGEAVYNFMVCNPGLFLVDGDLATIEYETEDAMCGFGGWMDDWLMDIISGDTEATK